MYINRNRYRIIHTYTVHVCNYIYWIWWPHRQTRVPVQNRILSFEPGRLTPTTMIFHHGWALLVYIPPTGQLFLLLKSHYSIWCSNPYFCRSNPHVHYWSNLTFHLAKRFWIPMITRKNMHKILSQARVTGRAVQRARGSADTWPQQLCPRGWSFIMFPPEIWSYWTGYAVRSDWF